MHLDVLDLRNFYYRTQLGRVAQRAIRDKVVDLWPPLTGQTVAGFGFAVPLLRPYLTEARRVIGLMPGPQGVMPWPAGEANVSVLCEDALWPLATGFVDRLVLMHGLETSENPGALLDEVHRVLGPGGRALFIVPNRAGLWSRSDATPFGFGRPYTAGQLEAQLKRHGFTPERNLTVLHAPPSQAPFWLRTANFWEKLGRHLPWLSGGVLMVEASKQVYAPTRGGLGAVITKPIRVLEGLGQPLPSPLAPLQRGRVRDGCPQGPVLPHPFADPAPAPIPGLDGVLSGVFATMPPAPRCVMFLRPKYALPGCGVGNALLMTAQI